MRNIFFKTLLLVILILPLMIKGQTLFQPKTKFEDAISVLNVGTFHMGNSSDAITIEFDSNDPNNRKLIHQIARELAVFKPTIIVVESLPKNQESLIKKYNAYRIDSTLTFENPSEIELLAYEIGRLSGTEKIVGIDYTMEYNYGIANQLTKPQDITTLPKYYNLIQENEQAYFKALGRPMTPRDHILMSNENYYLDFLININSDMLTHVSTLGEAQGAKEAAKFYERNLIMYSNFNQIPLSSDDRVLILMGATHTAFFKYWLERSPKYIPQNVFDYLKP